MNTSYGAKIELVSTLDQLNTAVEALRDVTVLPFDVETAQKWTFTEEADKKAPIDFNRLSLRSMQFGTLETIYVLDCALVPNWQESESFVNLLTNDNVLKIAHNKNFEYKVLKRAGVVINRMGCTMLTEQILQLGLLNKAPALAELVAKYCGGLVMEKDIRDTFVTEQEVLPLRPEQIEYAANDVDILLPIHTQQWAEVQERQIETLVEFEWTTRRSFGNIELRGVLVDPVRWDELHQAAVIEHDKAKSNVYQQFRADALVRWEQRLREHEVQRALLADAIESCTDADERTILQETYNKIPSWLKQRPNSAGIREPKKTAMWHFDKVLTSPMQMKEVFALNGIEVEDTNERTLLRQKYFTWQGREGDANYPARGLKMIDDLLEFRGLDKRISTYGPTWLRHVSPVTQRVHAEYDILKETGRTGCQRPNVQNVPKRGSGAVYRTAFVPAPGNVFIVADYSQIELRVAADFSGDRNMIDAFNSGVDFHTVTAAKMFNVPLVEITDGVANKDKKYTDMRRAAKSVNFGIIFGIGRHKLSEQITFDSGTVCSPHAAAKFLQLYAHSYPRLMEYLKELEKRGQTLFFSDTHLGHRRRFLPPVEPVRGSKPWKEFVEEQDKYKMRMGGIGRESKNTPIQGSAACIAKIAINELETILPKYNAGIVMFVHDEIVVEGAEIEAEEVLGIVSRTMQKAGRQVLKHLTAEVDAHIASNWLADGDSIIEPGFEFDTPPWDA